MNNQCPLPQNDMIFNLEKGLFEERRALELYKELLANLTDEEDRKKVIAIIGDEKRHIQIVENLILLTKKGFIA